MTMTTAMTDMSKAMTKARMAMAMETETEMAMAMAMAMAMQYVKLADKWRQLDSKAPKHKKHNYKPQIKIE